MVIVLISCGVCESPAGMGWDSNHAEHSILATGGRVIAGLRVCRRCARSTR